MPEIQTGKICGIQLSHYTDGIEIVFEQYEDDGVNYDDNEVLQSIQLGKFTKSEIDRFYKPLSQKADGYTGEVTQAFVDELKAIIEQNLSDTKTPDGSNTRE